MIGKTVGHSRITTKLGAGGMGEVFLAEATRLERKAAIKFLQAEMSADPERRQRFLNGLEVGQRVALAAHFCSTQRCGASVVSPPLQTMRTCSVSGAERWTTTLFAYWDTMPGD